MAQQTIDANKDRLDRLHDNSFVWDFCPVTEALVLTDRLEEVIEEKLGAGWSQPRTFEYASGVRISELEEDPEVAILLRDLWRRAGVNSVLNTMSALDSMPGDVAPLFDSIAYWLRRVQASGYMRLVTGADSAVEAWRAGDIGVMLGMQDATVLPRRLGVLDRLRFLGIRVIQLTYNLRNLIGDGCAEPAAAGLSLFGIDFVRRMNELGIVVDLSHCGSGTTLDAISRSTVPVAVTHSFAKALRPHIRGKSDDELRALADSDGFFGVTTVAHFLADEPEPSIGVAIDHLEYVVDIMGPARVGICSDWGAWSPDFPDALRQGVRSLALRRGFEAKDGMSRASAPGGACFAELRTYTDWRVVTHALGARGYSDDEIRGFLGGNWLAFLRRAGVS